MEQTMNTKKLGKSGRPIEPLSQGRLDSLCSLYSVVNAVRLAAHPRHVIGRNRGKQMIDAIARSLGKKFRRIFEGGTNNLKPILKAANKWLEDTYGQTVEARQPFRGQNRSPQPSLVNGEIRRHLAKPHTAVIVATTEHWTVIRRATPKHYELFDSDGLKFFR
jgi:hypothetical protein